MKKQEQIDIVRKMIADGVVTQEQAAKYFPELAEGEGERTWIINYLSNRILNSTIIAEKENLKKAIAWLKKQGEQKPIESMPEFKEGDILYNKDSYTSDSIFIFKGMSDKTNAYLCYARLYGEKDFSVYSKEAWDKGMGIYSGEFYPANHKQKKLLFQKMKEAGYEWDAEKKELKKIEQKHFCKLDNSYARIKFPFKAKVKSSGKIVTIHDGQLSYDGKEWIKYQSEAKDGYKVYEPNDLLELVCETEQNSARSEEDEKMLSDIVKDLVHPWNEYIPDRIEDEIKWLKNRLKSLRPQSTWKPSDEQIMALRWVLNHIPYSSHKEEINGLLEQYLKGYKNI